MLLTAYCLLLTTRTYNSYIFNHLPGAFLVHLLLVVPNAALRPPDEMQRVLGLDLKNADGYESFGNKYAVMQRLLQMCTNVADPAGRLDTTTCHEWLASIKCDTKCHEWLASVSKCDAACQEWLTAWRG